MQIPSFSSESTESSEETVTVTERTDTESTDWRSSYTDTDEDTVGKGFIKLVIQILYELETLCAAAFTVQIKPF